ncbi:hypothetical protein FQA39_LY05757 [Lamprigera yunnana]|nr:hypothetical protein FQA39_LY05757 [Lamprigera yunnana]
MATKEKDDEKKFILECIEVYHSLPALWNIKSKDYSNRIKKNEQYNNLLRKYREYYPDADKAQLVKKFNSLRTNFRKELKRIKDSEKSGAGTDDIIEPTLWYFEEMNFLVGQEEPSTSQKLISLAQNHLQEPQTEFDKIASAWAVELQKMKPQQQLFAKKAINYILFEGQMGSLHRDSIQINCLSRTSTPSTTMQQSPIYYDTLHAPSLISGYMEPLNGGNAGPSHASQYFSNFQ